MYFFITSGNVGKLVYKKQTIGRTSRIIQQWFRTEVYTTQLQVCVTQFVCSCYPAAVKFEQGYLYKVGTFIVNSEKRISSCVNAATLLRDICVISAIVRNKMPEVVKGRTFIKFMGLRRIVGTSQLRQIFVLKIMI